MLKSYYLFSFGLIIHKFNTNLHIIISAVDLATLKLWNQNKETRMKPIFITATNTNIGKTFVTLKLIETLAKSGVSVGVFKPIETGVVDDPNDARLLLEACQKVNPNFIHLSPKEITAYTFSLPAAPFCADNAKEIDIEHILEKQKELSSLCDILLIEGAGGLCVPITKEYYMIDLARDMNTRTLLVTPAHLGCISSTLLSIEALKSREMTYDWCVNLHEDEECFTTTTKPFYDEVYPDWWSVERGLGDYADTMLRM